jgi:hypothetical protein
MNHPFLELLRRSLDSGQTIDVEGLGTFRRTAAGGYHLTPQTQPRIFIAYAVEDLAPVRRLCQALRSAGCSPWLDKDKLLPGQNWPRAIERAIETSDACIVCFSSRSVSKRGQFQSELRYAVDCARRLPLDHLFLIPVRLETCTVPGPIAQQLQYVDLFPDWNRGVKRIVSSIRRAAPLRAGVVLAAD